MQHGDLEEWSRPRYVIVIEGVLCDVVPIMSDKRFMRAEKVTGYHINWHEVPLKRAVFMKDKFPDNAMDLITFISPEFLDTAAEFLNEARIPYDTVRYQSMERFTATLRFQSDVTAIYDSDPGRLDQYGQKGIAVQRGMDF